MTAADSIVRRYCPRCGGRAFEVADPNVDASCAICGWEHYRAVTPGILEALAAELELHLAHPGKARMREPKHGALRLG